jgi:hypothetical protein
VPRISRRLARSERKAPPGLGALAGLEGPQRRWGRSRGDAKGNEGIIPCWHPASLRHVSFMVGRNDADGLKWPQPAPVVRAGRVARYGCSYPVQSFFRIERSRYNKLMIKKIEERERERD